MQAGLSGQMHLMGLLKELTMHSSMPRSGVLGLASCIGQASADVALCSRVCDVAALMAISLEWLGAVLSCSSDWQAAGRGRLR